MTGRVGPERQDRVFHSFRRWPLVPTEDLVKLGQSLRQVQELGGPTAAGELLLIVDYELHRRGHTVPEGQTSVTDPRPQ